MKNLVDQFCYQQGPPEKIYGPVRDMSYKNVALADRICIKKIMFYNGDAWSHIREMLEEIKKDIKIKI